MNFKFENIKLSGILSIIPENKVNFLDEMDNYGFSEKKCLDLQRTIGLNERRIVKEEECTSDLCLAGVEYLISKKYLQKEDIGALIIVTQTPDHFIPPTSSILHGKLELDENVLCMDINQGCAGYLYGLLQAFLLISGSDIQKAVLLNGDTLSRRACQRDRNIYPLIGDAAAITVIEKDMDYKSKINLNLKTDGTRADWLMIPAGAFRTPSTEQTCVIKTLKDGNQRSDEDFYMNGAGVFSFTQTVVPSSIKDFLERNSTNVDAIDYFMFHQPNRFLLTKLAKKLEIPMEKIPSNIVEKYGNSSSATIPMAICDNINELLIEKTAKICMSGFGVGLSWGALLMDVGPLEFCEIIEN